MFLSSVSIIIVTFGLYGLFLLCFSIKDKSVKKTFKQSFSPFISVILPTYNEGQYIRKKIKNLMKTTYNQKKIEIIIVDDSTEKASKSKISKIAQEFPNIKVHSSNVRRGYSKSLLDGFKLAKGEIIIITDCGSLYELTTINELIHPFEDPKIGGVTGAAFILNQNEQSGKSEIFYRKIYNFMRKSESNADSTFHFHGEVSAVRKELLDKLRCFPTNLDIAIAFHIRKQGYKVLFNPKAKFSEYTPIKFNERVKQKSLRASGLILVLLGYRGMFSPQYGLFGLIIYPAHLSMMVLCPLSILSGFFSFLYLIGADPNTGLFLLLIISIIAAVLIFIIKRELIVNIFQLEIALLQGIWNAFTSKNEVMYIERIDSTRRS
ncbi:MAG: glycosyltransferase [Candidatus Hermodarchaeota archaeon]